MKKNLRLLNDTVLNMLAYSKDRKPAVCLSNVRDLCDDAVALMTEQAAALQVELVIDYEDQFPEMVLLDDAAIRRCLINLVGNAIDACVDRKDGRVILQVKRQSCVGDGGFSIRVSDNGCGMTNEVLSRLFTPFFSTKGNRGTGLGLTVTQKLMHEHGGSVTAHSTPGTGTTFTLEFPQSLVEDARKCLA